MTQQTSAPRGGHYAEASREEPLGQRRGGDLDWDGHQSFKTWFLFHLQASISTVGRLLRSPAATLMTAAVIAIAMALPLGLYLVIENLLTVSERWERGAQLSVFLDTRLGDEKAAELGRALEKRVDVARVTVLTRGAALRELQDVTGIAGIEVAFAGNNPLPAVLLVNPSGHLTQAGFRPRLQSLASELGGLPEVSMVQFEGQWLDRLHALLEIGARGTTLLAVLLGLGLVLVVSNAIGSTVEARREEIAIARLCGATDGFIARPFLYAGAGYGFLGALLAWLIVSLGGTVLSAPVERLVALYPGGLPPISLSVGSALLLLIAGTGLGVTGAFIAVARQVRKVQSG